MILVRMVSHKQRSYTVKLLGYLLALIHVMPILLFSWLTLFDIYEPSNTQWVTAFIMAMFVVFVSSSLEVVNSNRKREEILDTK